MKKPVFLVQRTYQFYIGKQLPLASAALSYYMTMTFFPLIICLYTLLGNNYSRAVSILAFAESFLSAESIRTLRSFLTYVAQNHSTAMFYAGVTVMVTSASAAVRSIEVTIGRMQGWQRYRGVWGLLFSFLFSIAFLIATYSAILVMFTSRDVLNLVNDRIPFLDFSSSWHWVKYLILSAITYVILWGLYQVSRDRDQTYRTSPGALLATVGMVGMSMIFSRFIAASARYSVVYGSLASIILLMYWLFLVCQIIYVGAAYNLALRDWKAESAGGSGAV